MLPPAPRKSSRLGIAYGYDRAGAVDESTAAALADQATRWDGFYTRNESKFFKDRHWMTREWPVMQEAERVRVCCELGCGVGNSLFPLLQSSAIERFYSCDFAASAVALLRAHADFDAARVTAYVADVSVPEQVLAHAPREGCDVALLIFVLSALDFERMPRVVETAHAALKRGGLVLCRDYALDDATHIKFRRHPASRVLSEQLCVRGDGTKAYFFTLDSLAALFTQGGFAVDELTERVTEAARPGGNPRRFVQGQFRKL